MAELLNRRGNDHDVKCAIQCNWNSITIGDLRASITSEKRNKKRKTVITLLERAMRKKEKEVSNG